MILTYDMLLENVQQQKHVEVIPQQTIKEN